MPRKRQLWSGDGPMPSTEWRGLCPDCMRQLSEQEKLAKQLGGERGNQHTPVYIWRGAPFSKIEYKILRTLESVKGVVSLRILALIVYGPRVKAPIHATRQRVYILRDKIEAAGLPYQIQTVGKRGYQLVKREVDS